MLRHSGANTCRVRLESLDAEVRLTVHDTGKGGDAKEGLGLAGMRERVTALGGNFAINGTGGTTIAVTLPTTLASGRPTATDTATDARRVHSPLMSSDPEPAGAE